MKTINYSSLPISELLGVINVDSQTAKEVKLSVNAHYIRCTKEGVSIINDVIDIIHPYYEATIENDNECSNITLSDSPIKLIGEKSEDEGDYSISIKVYRVKNRITRSCTESYIL